MSLSCIDIAHAAGLQEVRRSGSEHYFCCPKHDDHDPSLLLNSKKNCFMCPPCGAEGNAWHLAAFLNGWMYPCDKDRVHEWLRERELLQQNSLKAPSSTGTTEPWEKIWNATVAANHDSAEPLRLYLRNRGFSINQAPDSIRFHSQLTYLNEAKDRIGAFPALVALASLPDTGARAIHRIYLDSTGQKANVSPAKKALGEVNQGAGVYFDEPAEAMNAVEGIENGLAVWQATSLPTIAAVSASGLSNLAIPKCVKTLNIWADADIPGRREANKLAMRAAASGIEAHIFYPRSTGDWNDVLRLEGPAALMAELEREQTEQPPEDFDFIETAADFLSSVDVPREYLIPDIIQRGIQFLIHGDARAMKSTAVREMVVSMVTQTPAFGIPRLTPHKKFTVLYACQDSDPREEIKQIFKSLFRARGITEWPEDNLLVSVHKNLSLDDPACLEKIERAIQKRGIDCVIVDAARRFTKKADKGPADVGEVTAAVRAMMNRTGVTFGFIHHDTKPPEQNYGGGRKRSHRASGGDWFAASECPISVTKITETRSLVVPEDYKYSLNPQPFSFDRVEDDQGLRLIGKNEEDSEAANLELTEEVTSLLKCKPNLNGTQIQREIKKKKQFITDCLERLKKAGILGCHEVGRAKNWFVVAEDERSGL